MGETTTALSPRQPLSIETDRIELDTRIECVQAVLDGLLAYK